MDIIAIVRDLGPWAWVIGGCLLLAAEIVVSGIFLFWFGLAAVAVGAITLATPLGWQTQVVLFGILALVAVLVGRMVGRLGRRQPAEVFLNRRGESFLGRTLELTEPIVRGEGRVAHGDTLWRVSGPDLPAGTDVRVVDVRGATLVVEPAQAAASGSPQPATLLGRRRPL
jgi:membrane protein implicated in regulation of membrane protease activity